MRKDWSSRRLQSCSPRRLRTSFKSNLDIFLRELELGWEFAKNVSQNPERQIILNRCGWPTSLSCLLRRAKSGWPSQPRLHQGDRKYGLPIVLCCIENIQLLEKKVFKPRPARYSESTTSRYVPASDSSVEARRISSIEHNFSSSVQVFLSSA